jgi:DNA-damage-inducible protein D
MGLYAGERARDIATRKGLRPGQHILDHMGSTELAANLFRATQTEEKLKREGITDKGAANMAHNDMGKAVRSFIKIAARIPLPSGIGRKRCASLPV